MPALRHARSWSSDSFRTSIQSGCASSPPCSAAASNASGSEESARRMPPADERLGTAHDSLAEVDLRLVEHDELTTLRSHAGARPSSRAGAGELSSRPGEKTCEEPARASPHTPRCPRGGGARRESSRARVQSRSRCCPAPRATRRRSRRGGAIPRYAAARPPPARRARPSRARSRRRTRRPRAGRADLALADDVVEPARDDRQQLVPPVVAERVVDLLEPLEIDEEHASEPSPRRPRPPAPSSSRWPNCVRWQAPSGRRAEPGARWCRAGDSSCA